MDPYDVLNINRNSTDEEVKKAYKNLARLHHPDKGGNEEEFKKINHAYSQITKEAELPLPDMSDFINLFGGIFSKNNYVQGPTVKTYTTLSLEQLEIGGKYKVKYSRNIPTGKTKQEVQYTMIGSVNIITPEEMTKEYETEVDIPPCHDQRYPITFIGLAKAERVPAGNLEVYIKVLQHKVFKRVGALDLSMDITISLKEALIGFKRTIQLLNGTDVIIDCENVVNPYDIKNIRTYGLNKSEFEKGDLIIKFIIIFPVILSSDTLEKIKELEF